MGVETPRVGRFGEQVGGADPARAATEGFSFGLTTAACFLVFGAGLVAVLLPHDRARTT